MALTKVSGQIIDQPFDVGIITASNQYVSGIATFGGIRVLGDLQIDGTTTTLDTVVTEVDRLEVGANNNTVGVAITQSGTGDIFNLYDGSTEVFTVRDGGTIGINNASPDTTYKLDVIGAGVFATDSNLESNDFNVGQLTVKNNQAAKGAVIDFRADSNNGTQGVIAKIGGFNTYDGTGYDGALTFSTRNHSASAMVERLRVTSDGKVRIPDSGKFTAGAGNDLQIYHDGSNSYIENYTGHFYIFNATNDKDILLQTDDGSGGLTNYIKCDGSNGYVRLFHYGSQKLNTKSDGVDITGELQSDSLDVDGNALIDGTLGVTGEATFTTHINLGDSDKAKFGASGDLEIYHDGSHSYIEDAGEGALKIKGNDIRIENTSSRNVFKAVGTACELFFDNGSSSSKKFETTATGVSVTGNIDVSNHINLLGNLDMADDDKILLGTGDDLQIYHDGTDSHVDNSTGDLILRSTGDDVIIRATDDVIIQNGGADNAIICNNDGNVELYFNTAKKFETTATGAKVTGALEVTQEYPSIRPTLDLNFAATKTLDRRITFTRDSVGTFTDDMGIVRLSSNNVPRFDHDPTTGESLGLLIEESRTNQLSSHNGTYVGNYRQTNQGLNTTGPDGVANSAREFTPDSNSPTGGSTLIVASTNLGVNGTTKSWSCFLKVTRSDSIAFRFNDNNNNINSSTYTLYANGADPNLESAGNNGSTTVEKYPNGWYRFKWQGFVGSSNSSSYLQIYCTSHASTNGSTVGYAIWGQTFESGAFSTSPILTNGSTVTRAQDLAKITGTNFTDFYNQTEGTAFVHTLMPHSKGATGLPAYAFKTSANSNYYLGFSRDNTGAYHFVKTSNADSYAYESLVNEYRAVLGIKTNDLNSYINDANQNVNLSTVTLFDADILQFGSTTTSNVLNGHIKQFKYYNKRLPDAQLQGLTQQ